VLCPRGGKYHLAFAPLGLRYMQFLKQLVAQILPLDELFYRRTVVRLGHIAICSIYAFRELARHRANTSRGMLTRNCSQRPQHFANISELRRLTMAWYST
jgi:hypothetical protein